MTLYGTALWAPYKLDQISNTNILDSSSASCIHSVASIHRGQSAEIWCQCYKTFCLRHWRSGKLSWSVCPLGWPDNSFEGLLSERRQWQRKISFIMLTEGVASPTAPSRSSRWWKGLWRHRKWSTITTLLSRTLKFFRCHSYKTFLLRHWRSGKTS